MIGAVGMSLEFGMTIDGLLLLKDGGCFFIGGDPNRMPFQDSSFPFPFANDFCLINKDSLSSRLPLRTDKGVTAWP